jgi:O-6-methylguanine DNA methyltransferase
MSLLSKEIITPLGVMIAIADNDGLYSLEFSDAVNTKHSITNVETKTKKTLRSGSNHILESLENELNSYFTGHLREFRTPLHYWGSHFQNQVWQELVRTPYGQQRSYSNQAAAMGHPKAFRAVANANGANPMPIIIPCHRIIRNDGSLGGYSSGIEKKKWLLAHEHKFMKF